MKAHEAHRHLGALGRPHVRAYLAGGGLGELGDTGIPAIDNVINQTQQKIDRLVTAVEVGTVASLVGATVGLLLLLREVRR